MSNIEHPDITPRHIDEEHECTQRGGSYIRGPMPHICAATSGQLVANKISKAIKTATTQRVFDSAAEIVDEVKINK